MSGRILIYDNATGDNRFGNAGNYVNLNCQPANTIPGAGDIVLYGAATYSIGDFNIGGGSTGPVEGAAVFAPGANVTFGAPDPDRYTFGSLIQPYGSNVTLSDAGFSIGNVLLGPGSHLTFGNARPDTVDAISNIWNEGGTLTLSPNNTYLLGGPGFIQSSGITSTETEVHSGDNMWINLGNIAQGATNTGGGIFQNDWQVELNLLNATGATIPDVIQTWDPDGGFGFKGPNGIVQYTPGSFKGVGAVLADTSQLGAHVEQLKLGPYTVGIWDNVVKA
jgi:hypothetical protein